MKKLFLIVGLSVLLAFQFHSDERLNVDFAKHYLAKIEQQTAEVCEKYGLEIQDVLPIVFPECARFDNQQNAFESALVQFNGAQNSPFQVDFSVGYFQMKPSFIERLDLIVQKDSSLVGLKSAFSYSSTSTEKIREERLDRIFNEKWQIEYLCLFTKIMKLRYEKEKPSISFIEFAASAYNLGFHKTTKEIENWSKIIAFPNGITNSANNVSYAALASTYKIQRYGNKN
jgi:hypothetical protein